MSAPTIQCVRCRVCVPTAALHIKDRCTDRNCPLRSGAGVVTRDILAKASVTAGIHLDATGYFQNHFRCVDFPRLTIVDTGPRGKPRPNIKYGRAYFVDGVECADLDEVVVRLNLAAPEAKAS